MDHNIINTLEDRERVTSTYAEIYFDDNFCDNYIPQVESAENVIVDENISEWISPSDLLVNVIDLKPPFTSKINRGLTHEGIINVGNELLGKEQEKFLNYLYTLLQENDTAWTNVLEHEKATVNKKVHEIYKGILKKKTEVLKKEIDEFYEQSLNELENNLKSQVQNILISTHANIISKLNIDIKQKLENEKTALKKNLTSRYKSEKAKIMQYYELLFNHELYKNNLIINKAATERNDAIKAFCRQMEAEKICATMYIMSTERKKCRIKQFILENYQNTELKEHYQKLKEKQKVIDILKSRETEISQINKEWEDKIKEILQVFLKFISFSLKLLPEQSSFLLNFEQMVVLQLNDIINMNNLSGSTTIFIDEEETTSFSKLKKTQKEECLNDPFVIEGDLTPTPPPVYGSRETLPENVDLPTLRIQRQFVYAKCHHFEEIKAMLEAQRCTCRDPLQQEMVETESVHIENSVQEDKISSKSSLEHFLTEDINRLIDCPLRNCRRWLKPSPHLMSYSNFDDEKYQYVLATLGDLPKNDAPHFVHPKEITYVELPFAATTEPFHTTGTQYSSQEDLNAADVECTCKDDYFPLKQDSVHRIKESQSKLIIESLEKRRISLRRLFQKYPDMMKVFTEDSFNIMKNAD